MRRKVDCSTSPWLCAVRIMEMNRSKLLNSKTITACFCYPINEIDKTTADCVQDHTDQLQEKMTLYIKSASQVNAL